MLFKVGALLALVVIAANAAPLYEQETELFQELLQAPPGKVEKTAAKVAKDVGTAVETATEGMPFSEITKTQHKVYGLQKDAIEKHDTYLHKKMLVPFKVSAARDKAEEKEREEQEKSVKEAKTANTKAQKKTDALADKTFVKANKKATKTQETEMEKVHKILHPDKKAKEEADKHFLKGMAKQAEGDSVVINADTDANMFRPGGLGDQPPAGAESTADAVKKAVKKEVKAAIKKKVAADEVKKAVKDVAKGVAKAAKSLPTAEEMELAMAVPEKDFEEIADEDMRQQDEVAYAHSQSMFSEALENY